MTLDLSSLGNAIAQGDEALAYCGGDLARADAQLAMHLRAGAIRAFEFIYELSIKTLRRYLIETEANPAAVEEMSFNDLIRRAYELGLIEAELADWKEFRRHRGTTSHTYDAAKAQAVFEIIPTFLAEARFLAARIAERQEPSA